MGTLVVIPIRACDLRFRASLLRGIAPSRRSAGLALLQRYSLRSPAHHRPDVSLSRALPRAFASSSIPPAGEPPVGPYSKRLDAESHQRGTPFPLAIARTLRVTLSTGFRDGAHGSVRWLPASYPVPFGSSVSASYAGSLSRWLNHVFASATHRFLRDGVSGLRLPDTAVYPRCSPLRTSRKAGGYACTSAPEGRGLHPHEDGVTRPCGLAACLEVLTSFQPTGRRPDLVVRGITAHRKPPEVRICRLRNQSAVGNRPPSTSTPH
jgi:hypothetical protein